MNLREFPVTYLFRVLTLCTETAAHKCFFRKGKRKKKYQERRKKLHSTVLVGSLHLHVRSGGPRPVGCEGLPGSPTLPSTADKRPGGRVPGARAETARQMASARACGLGTRRPPRVWLAGGLWELPTLPAPLVSQCLSPTIATSQVTYERELPGGRGHPLSLELRLWTSPEWTAQYPEGAQPREGAAGPQTMGPPESRRPHEHPQDCGRHLLFFK